MKEIMKVLEWIANKFRKTTTTTPEPPRTPGFSYKPGGTSDLFEQIKVALNKMDEYGSKTTDITPEPPHLANDQPITVIGWLETLPDGYRELAIKNNSCVSSESCTCLNAALLMSFSWGASPEREEFWLKVQSYVLFGDKLPPLPQTPPNDSNDSNGSKFQIIPKSEIKKMDTGSPVDDIGDIINYEMSRLKKSLQDDRGKLLLQSGALYYPGTSPREILEQELQTCIAAENYERCAEIKAQLDMLNKVND